MEKPEPPTRHFLRRFDGKPFCNVPSVDSIDMAHKGACNSGSGVTLTSSWAAISTRRKRSSTGAC